MKTNFTILYFDMEANEAYTEYLNQYTVEEFLDEIEWLKLENCRILSYNIL